MTEPDPTQPLIRAPSQQTAINVGAPEQGRSTRAYKVAGITLLACVLIVGQAMTAYFLLSQKNDIKSLEEQSNQLKTQMTKGRSVSVPMRMHMPMNTLTELMDYTAEESGTDSPAKFDPSQATDCQLEAAGLKPVQVPGFIPACDEQGLYKSQQCFLGQCWCVEPASGKQVPCAQKQPAASVFTGGMSRMMALPNDHE